MVTKPSGYPKAIVRCSRMMRHGLQSCPMGRHYAAKQREKEEPGEAKEETSAAPGKEEPGEAKAEDEEVVQDEERKGGEKKEKKKEPTRGKKRKSEQNLDIPKRLKSSQAPESNEPTCGEVQSGTRIK